MCWKPGLAGGILACKTHFLHHFFHFSFFPLPLLFHSGNPHPAPPLQTNTRQSFYGAHPPLYKQLRQKTRHGGWWIQWWPGLGLGLRLHLRCGYPSVDGNYRGQVMVSWASTNTFAHSTRSFLLRLESMLGTGLLLTIFVSTFQQCCRQPCGLQQWACAAAAHHGRNQADSNTTVWTASTPHQRARTCACRRMLAVRLILSPALCAVGKHRNVVCSEGATWATVQLEGIAWCSVHAQQRRSPPHAPRKNK